MEGLRAAVIAGYRALIGLDGKSTDDGASLHAAAATVAVMEDHWAFNAGYGSVLNEVKSQRKKEKKKERKKERKKE